MRYRKCSKFRFVAKKFNAKPIGRKVITDEIENTIPPLRKWQANAVPQFVNGAIRGMVEQSAYLYLPDHPDLVAFARDMSIDRTHVLSESSVGKRKPAAAATLGKLFQGGKVDVAAGLTVLPGSEFSEDELKVAERWRSNANLGYLPLEVVASLLRANVNEVGA